MCVELCVVLCEKLVLHYQFAHTNVSKPKEIRNCCCGCGLACTRCSSDQDVGPLAAPSGCHFVLCGRIVDIHCADAVLNGS